MGHVLQLAAVHRVAGVSRLPAWGAPCAALR